MDMAFQNAIVQLGCAGLLIGFMYLRLKRADKREDEDKATIEKLTAALVAVSTETKSSLTEIKTLFLSQDRRQ